MIELAELQETKLYGTPNFHCYQGLTATTINAATQCSISSCCSSSTSGSSRATIMNSNANIDNISSSISPTTAVSPATNGKFIDCNGLISFIDKSIILDCRLLKEYENKNIKNSVHINCRDKITKKRLSTKKLSVKDIIGCEETKKKIDSSKDVIEFDNEIMIVVYDDQTSDDNDLFLDQNPLQIVLDNIKNTIKNMCCKILKGGFREFSKSFPHFCVQKQKVNISCPISYDNSEETFKYAIENAKMSKIMDHIYLGNESDAKNEEQLSREGITHIINVTKNIPCYHQENKMFTYLRIPVNDACNQNLKQHFAETIKFIDDAKSVNGKVLVHCQAGISRSPTIVIAYLMKITKLSMNSAYNEVKDKRVIIGPNIIFLSQLYDYEKNLTESSGNAAAEILTKCNNINNNNIEFGIIPFGHQTPVV